MNECVLESEILLNVNVLEPAEILWCQSLDPLIVFLQSTQTNDSLLHENVHHVLILQLVRNLYL